jgi:hypothetical protein
MPSWEGLDALLASSNVGGGGDDEIPGAAGCPHSLPMSRSRRVGTPKLGGFQGDISPHPHIVLYHSRASAVKKPAHPVSPSLLHVLFCLMPRVTNGRVSLSSTSPFFAELAGGNCRSFSFARTGSDPFGPQPHHPVERSCPHGGRGGPLPLWDLPLQLRIGFGPCLFVLAR